MDKEAMVIHGVTGVPIFNFNQSGEVRIGLFERMGIRHEFK